MPTAVLKAKRKAESSEPDVPDNVDTDGFAILEIENSIDFDTCYVQLTHLPDRNRSSVQIKSYQSLDSMTYPSLFIYTTVDDISLATLQGETLSCRIYVQTKKDGPIWSTTNSLPVKLQITSVRPQFKARIIPAVLTATGHGRTSRVTGELAAVAPETKTNESDSK